MKPICVKMQAFGAYISEEIVDFTNLNKSGLFLITGSTGGGKTTILDAMCFALYGKATGGLRSWENMRSIGAPTELPTVVDYIFTLGDKEYRFYRSQVLYKSRKNNEIKIKGEYACYSKEDGQWQQLFSGAESKLTAYAENLLGLDCDQFSKVIVLPQGEFRKLLLSNSNEKGKIFEKLFNMGKWSQITGRIMGLADNLKKEADTYRIKREEIFHSHQVTSTQNLEDNLKDLRLQYKNTVADKEKTDKEHTLLQERLADMTSAQAITQQLAEISASITNKGKILQHTKVHLDKIANDCKQVPILNQQIKQLSEEKAKQQECLKKAERYHQLKQISNQLSTDISHSQQEQKICAENIETAKNNITVGEKYIEELSASLQGISALYAKLQILKETATKCKEIEAEKKSYEILNKNAEAALAEQEKARISLCTYNQSYTATENQLKSNMSATLAVTLKQGEECPVCGSVNHPHLAKATDLSGISLEERLKHLKGLKENAEGLLTEKTAIYKSCIALAQKSKEKITELTNTINLDNNSYYKTYNKDLEKTTQEIARAEKNTALLEKAKQRLAQRRTEYETARTNLEKATININNLSTKFASNTEEIIRLEKELTDHSTSKQEIAKAITQLTEKISQTENTVNGLQAEFNRLTTEQEKLKAEVNGLEEQRIAQDKALSILKEKGIVFAQTDYTELQQLVQSTKARLGEINSAVGGLSQKILSVERSLDHIKALEEKGADTERKYSSAQRLSQFLQGKNPLKIPIKNYVLGIMLDDILLQANQYLKDLSHGRYSLNRISERTTGNSLNGLELEIFDAEYGSNRAINTLSGGELFLSSLSLAFGLSDIVQGYSGGICIDSIFIDEGFGSLDNETIDTAMAALNSIHAMGRTIGIISHVEQLRNQIFNRIEVNSDSRGSSIRIICG